MKTWKTYYMGFFNSDTPWEAVCKQSKKENNISQERLHLHPQLRLRGERSGDQANSDLVMNNFNNPSELSDFINARPGNSVLLPTSKVRSFNQLPNRIQLEILGHLLVFDEVVHAISRLDEWCRPTQPPEEGIKGVKLLHRFHVGSAPVCLTHASKPEILLAPLSVSKAWNTLGCYLFYGLNTFAFSSLGE